MPSCMLYPRRAPSLPASLPVVLISQVIKACRTLKTIDTASVLTLITTKNDPLNWVPIPKYRLPHSCYCFRTVERPFQSKDFGNFCARSTRWNGSTLQVDYLTPFHRVLQRTAMKLKGTGCTVSQLVPFLKISGTGKHVLRIAFIANSKQ